VIFSQSAALLAWLSGGDLDIVQLAHVLHAIARQQGNFLGLEAVDDEFFHDLVSQLPPSFLDHGASPFLGLVSGIPRQGDVDALVVAVFEIRAGAAEGREARGPGRHDHILEAQSPGVAVGMHWSGAAVGEANKAGGVVALGADIGAEVFVQRQVEQLDHAGCGVFH
jgi:hypothetical protein